MKLVLALIAVVAVSAYTELEYQNQFVAWSAKFEKTYTHDVFFTKYNTFKANLDLITAHNHGNHSYTMAVNQFADMTSEEFSKFVGEMPKEHTPINPTNVFVAPANAGPMDDSFDWRDQGAVTPVKDQGQCGSCWAFSTVGTLEGWWQIRSKKLVSFSEEQIVDCTTDGCYGCQGGWPYKALEYVEKNGLCSEDDYPYTAGGSCRPCANPAIAPGDLKSYTTVASEADLQAAIKVGPVSVLVEADRSAFQFYHSGVLDDASCGTQIDHAILAVGWGTMGTKDYWAVKNSWGVSWGSKGYINIVRNKNMCGISQTPVRPDA